MIPTCQVIDNLHHLSLSRSTSSLHFSVEIATEKNIQPESYQGNVPQLKSRKEKSEEYLIEVTLTQLS